MSSTVYDVTTWTGTTTSPYDDIGAVINSIIDDIHATQTTQTTRPGAVIYIPPGHYLLQTTVEIDVSFITIKGSGHGFMSEAVRDDYGSPGSWVEIMPGSSHIQIANAGQVGFRVRRNGTPAANGRVNGVVFQDFCIDGMAASKPYLPGNGKTGIKVEYDSDALRIEGMGFVYLAHAIQVTNGDAFNITNNFITECGSCIELLDSFIVGKITDNYLISAWGGFSIFMENGYGTLITGNSLLWAAKIQMKGVDQTNISANKFVSSFPGMIVHETPCNDNLISSNQFRREYGNGGPSPYDDLYGMVQIRGNGNAVSSNLLQLDIPAQNVTPAGVDPTMILVKAGDSNYLASNHLRYNVPSKVVLDSSTSNTKLYYSCRSSELVDYSEGSVSTAFTT